MLAVNIAGIKMKTPVMAASGTFGFGTEYSDFVDLIPNEVKRMNNLENIKDITLKKSDLLLYEIYKLFYCDTPNFFDNNDRIRAQVMMFILSEYGISIDTDIFSLSKD